MVWVKVIFNTHKKSISMQWQNIYRYIFRKSYDWYVHEFFIWLLYLWVFCRPVHLKKKRPDRPQWGYRLFTVLFIQLCSSFHFARIYWTFLSSALIAFYMFIGLEMQWFKMQCCQWKWKEGNRVFNALSICDLIHKPTEPYSNPFYPNRDWILYED